nr:Chain F, VAL-ASN-PRO-LEU-THR-LYS-LYS-GLY-GLU [Plasmodium falciparum 3D7]
VNPLTKKGE